MERVLKSIEFGVLAQKPMWKFQKQYADGNYAEVWFKFTKLEISDKAYSNDGYFTANDNLSKKTVKSSQVIPFMDKFKY